MKKFWNKAEETADIYIYGDIVQDRWSDSDVTAKKFVEDLNSFGGNPVTVHINSGGGDVFAGLAISNAIKAKGNVTISIDGLAASAASVVAMGGSKIKMADNALMMIHLPTVGLLGWFDEAEIAKIQAALTAIKSSIIDTYKSRAKGEVDVTAMVESETWINAKEALDMGFIDEITQSVEMSMNNSTKKLFVNSLTVDTSKFDATKFAKAIGGLKMSEVKNQAATPKTTDEATIRAEIRQQELNRIKDLQALKCANSAVNALVDVALEKGASAAEIKPYIDALSKIPAQKNAAKEIIDTIKDQMSSGAQDVNGGQDAPDEKEIQKKRIADFANKIISR